MVLDINVAEGLFFCYNQDNEGQYAYTYEQYLVLY
jgi:hypothetical protein